MIVIGLFLVIMWFCIHFVFANVKTLRDKADPERIQEDFIISDVDKQDWWKHKDEERFKGVPRK